MFETDRPASPRSPYNTLYAKLGVSADASAEDIESAYKVLEQTYRPRGAYVDDVMHLAFTEISNAAAILRNPRTRKAYDQGYIDERGIRTKAGAARAARVRAFGLGSGLLLASLAGFMIISSWTGTQTRGASQGTDHVEDKIAPVIEPQAAAQAEAISPASTPQPQEQASKPDVQQPPLSPPVHADDRDYLPPQEALDPKTPAGDQPAVPVQPAGNPYSSIPRKSAGLPQPRQDQQNLPRQEQRRPAWLSKPAQQHVQSTIRFGWPPHQSLRISESLRSAYCLACLTNHNADCSTACE